jgi:hypothetical protein
VTVRLDNVSHGHRLREKVILRLLGWLSRRRMPDVVRVLLYRREFFGDRYSALIQDALRGPSEWSVGERELFAAWTAHLEACHF